MKEILKKNLKILKQNINPYHLYHFHPILKQNPKSKQEIIPILIQAQIIINKLEVSNLILN